MTIFNIKLNQPSKIISLPNVYATLEDIVGGFYKYRITYVVDPVAVVREKAYIVNIHVSDQLNNDTNNPNLVKNNNPKDIILNLRKMGGLYKSAGLVTPKYLVSIKSDITSRLPNNQLPTLNTTNVLVNKTPLKTITQLSTKSVSTLNEQSQTNPVMTVSLNKPKSVDNGLTNQTVVNNKVKRQMTDLLFEGRIDPASLTTGKTNSISHSSKTYSGTIPSAPYTQKSAIKNDIRAMNIVASQLNSATKQKIYSQSQLSPQATMTIVEKIPVNLLTISEIVNIPIGSLGKRDFNIIFELNNGEGQLIQTEKRFVAHGSNISNIIPTKEPTVKSVPINVPGRALFEITQEDSNSKGIYIYRREINPNNQLSKSSYKLIGKVPLLKGAKAFYEDKIKTINNAIYRFVPYVTDEMPGSIFTSAAVRFYRSGIIKKEKYYRRQNSGVLFYNILDTYIEILLSQYSINAIEAKIYRRNVTNHQKEYDLVGISTLRNNSDTPISFKDYNVKNNYMYEYKAVLIYPDGSKQTAPNTIVVRYSPIQQNIAVTKISNLNITTYEGLQDVTFNIEYSLSEKDFELIKKLFKEQNLVSEYQRNIIENKDKLKTLLAYKIVRFNLTTGDIEDFGVITSTSFSDRQFGLSRSVKNLDSASEYVYKVITYIRSPETLMPKLTRTVATTVEGKLANYTLNPYKWLQPVTLTEGNIVTDRTLLTNHAKQPLIQGNVVDVQNIPINLSKILPVLSNANATQVQERSILIEWKVDGDLEKIDHFVIKLEMTNLTTIVGTVHNISSNNTFKFLDLLTDGESGSLSYNIVPMYYDYTQGAPIKTNTIVI
jgi:hypothetical protein